METGSSYNVLNLIFKMSLLNKNLTITLRGRDILGTQRQTWTSYVNDIKQTYLFYGDNYRNYTISISYKIGNKNIKEQKHNSGNEEERRRL